MVSFINHKLTDKLNNKHSYIHLFKFIFPDSDDDTIMMAPSGSHAVAVGSPRSVVPPQSPQPRRREATANGTNC